MRVTNLDIANFVGP